MNTLIGILSTLLFTLGLHATAAANEDIHPGITIDQLTYQTPIHWVSVAQIEESLSTQPPLAVGFDVDDTLLFTAAGFYRGEKTFSPGGRDFLKKSAFWEKMNNEWDAFSIPKKVGKELIAMHLKRGDKIFFITARPPTKTETLTKTLQDSFLIPDDRLHPVIFVGDIIGKNSKIQPLKDKQVKIYYGDSDADIFAAKAAGARGIRVLRAANSHYQPLHRAGSFGEEVIVNSAH